MCTKVWVSVAFWLMVTVSTSQAAIFGIVSGVVEDQQHRPIPQAEVVLHSQLSSWRERAQTDSDGHFIFHTVPAGEYTLSARKEGFQAVEQHVVVKSGTTTA